MAVEASAPGKLLLIGEYAVLEGAPALVLAVDRRARARVEWRAAGPATVDAPQLGLAGAELVLDERRMALRDASGSEPLGVTGRFLPRVLCVLGRPAADAARLRLEIDSGELYETGADHRPTKLGLGSSAAVCAALATALAGLFGGADDGPERRLAAWLPPYRDALGSDASGADLAAALFGGLIDYRKGELPAVRRLERPENMQWRVVWTGHPAQTTDYVGVYQRWRRIGHRSGGRMGRLDDDPDGIVGSMLETAREAAAGVAEARDGGKLVAAAARYAQLLIELGDAMGVDIMTERHRHLAELAAGCGAVYKSCGAGGGDLGIALATDAAPLEAFSGRVSHAGGVPLNLALSASGARLEKDRRT